MNFLASPWIPLVVLIMLALAARFYQRSWLAPSAFAPLIWSFYIFIPLIVAPEYKVSGLAVWTIVLLVFCLQIGAMLCEKNDFIPKPRATSRPRFSQKQILTLILMFSFVATTGEIYFAYTSLLENGMSISVGALVAIGHLLSVDRYSGVQEPTLVRLLVTWMYPAALLGGLMFAQTKTRLQRLISFCSIIPALFSGFFQSTKAPILMIFCCWISAYLATQISRTNGSYGVFNRRMILLVAILVICAVGLFVVSDAIRVHTYEQDFEVTADWSRVEGSTIGYLAVFSDWLSRENIQPSSFGVYTFAGFLNLIGLHTRALGLYEEIVVLPGQVDSNIYTAFRGLIEDFSLPGAALFCILLGGIGGASYNKALEGSCFGILLLAAYFAFIIWSPLASIVVYNGPLLGWIVGSFIFRKFPRPYKELMDFEAISSI